MKRLRQVYVSTQAVHYLAVIFLGLAIVMLWATTKPTSAQTEKAVLEMPVPGSELTNDTVLFSWTDTSEDPYYIKVGAVSEQGHYYEGEVLGNSIELSQLPNNGETIHFTLYTKIGSRHQANLYEFTAAELSNPNAAVLNLPVEGDMLESRFATFRWDSIDTITDYRLTIGDAPRGTEHLDYEPPLPAVIHMNLPTDGRTLYVSLYTKYNEEWLVNDFTYIAATVERDPAELHTPPPESTLTDHTVTFRWRTDAVRHYISVGRSEGSREYYEGYVNGTSIEIGGLPTDGQPLHVRLYTSLNDDWPYYDYVFTAATYDNPNVAEIETPAPGSDLTANSASFTWADVGDSYRLSVGSAPREDNYFLSDETTDTQVVAIELPTDGRKLYVTLETKVNGIWFAKDYEYTSDVGENTLSVMTQPAPRSVLVGDTVRFFWYPAATKQYLKVGDAEDIGKYFDGYVSGTSHEVTGLPLDGRPITVRLYSYYGTWEHNTYEYEASRHVNLGPNYKGNGQKLYNRRLIVDWTNVTPADEYEVTLGSTQDGNDYYDQSTTNRFAIINDLPIDGETLYLKISSRLAGGVWVDSYFEFTAVGLPFGLVEWKNRPWAVSSEFSGMTYNEKHNRVVMVEDEGTIYEFELNADKSIGSAAESLRRTITTSIDQTGTIDLEGIAWMYDDTYALANEDNGQIYIVNFGSGSNDTEIDVADSPTIETNIPELKEVDEETGELKPKFGVEGLAFDHGSIVDSDNPHLHNGAKQFFVVSEKPPMLYRVGWDGSPNGSLPSDSVSIEGISDVAGVYHSELNGDFYVVSDEDKRIVRLSVSEDDWSDVYGTATQVGGVIGLKNIKGDRDFRDIEGITLASDLSTLFIVSEIDQDEGDTPTDFTFGRFSFY